jgi:glycosyltransferase involved in cell wall biosynthesis
MPRDRHLNRTTGKLTTERGRSASRSAELDTAKLQTYLTRLRANATDLARELEKSRQDVQGMLASTSWRLTRPLRQFGLASPKLARQGRHVLTSLGLSRWLRLDERARISPVGAMTGRSPYEFLDLDSLKSQLSARNLSSDDLMANCRLLEASELFDEHAYRAASGIAETANAAEHYLRVGWREGLEPGPQFEGAFLEPYYRSMGFAGPPAITYLTLREQGWTVYATRAQAVAVASVLRASDLFDATAYAARVRLRELDPALHYVIVGEHAGFAPSDAFDPAYYGDRYPDIGEKPINRLEHYLASGRIEGRRPLPLAAMLDFDESRLKRNRDTILLVVHEASRTGAPILAYNLAKRLRRTYNIVAVLLSGGELVRDFETCCAAVVGPLTHADWHPGEIKYLVRHILAIYPVSFAIINSIVSWMCVQPLGRALVPVVLLVHEFASYTRPKFAMQQGLLWATQLVFSADLVALCAREEYPELMRRPMHILPQGRSDLPPARELLSEGSASMDLVQTFRPPDAGEAFVVMGCGSVHIRKGVDLFLSCAAAVAAMRPLRPIRFVWVGKGYDPENDIDYSCYLADQIARSRLQHVVAFTGEIADLVSAYALSDLFLLSSRLDPLPNVAIDAMLERVPVVCFEGTTGIAEILRANPRTRDCVVPHLDVQAAAKIIIDLAKDEPRRLRLADACQDHGRTAFDMDRYVSQLRKLGTDAVKIMSQRSEDLVTLRDDPLFDSATYLPLDAPRQTRSEAITDFIVRWAVMGTATVSRNYLLRRPCAGFHPQIYAHENAANYDTRAINPLAHFVRSGKPDGPWRHQVITAAAPQPKAEEIPPVALHAHFHYPELAEDFFRKLSASRVRCDLLLSTDERSKARMLRNVATQFQRGEVHIHVFPNRGRDIGAFLTGFGEDIASRYEIVGHLHGKRSVLVPKDPTLGERWREFLWQNLLGDRHSMMDVVIGRLATEKTLGLVFADDPHLVDWTANREIAEGLAARMGITTRLPPFFEFPLGTMFWARTSALRPLFDLKLGWDDYPQEPVPYDGTILHALERLLPFVAHHAGYRFATTHVPGVTR